VTGSQQENWISKRKEGRRFV